VSRDEGCNWREVTPIDLPEWAYIGVVEISKHKADTIYLSATRYKLDDYEPYLYKTQDGGKTWSSIRGDFPSGEITRVIRADPVRKGLLFVGTETGVFYSLNDGKHWVRMQGGLPVVPVYDLKIKDSDLVVATHGRSFWILDDITPLRETPTSSVRNDGGIRLFTPRSTYRLKLQWSAGIFDGDGKDYSPAFGIPGATYRQKTPDGASVRRHLDVGENPPRGVIFYYWLTEKPSSPITLSVYERTGRLIETFDTSDASKPEQRLPAELGLNRFVWDLSYPAAKSLNPALIERDYQPFAQESEGSGPTAPPGEYRADWLLPEGALVSNSFTLLKDPRVAAVQTDFDQQFEWLCRLTDKRSELRAHVDQIRLMRRQLRELPGKLAKSHRSIVSSASKIQVKLEEIENALIDSHRESPRDVLRHPAGFDDTLGELIWAISMADVAPPIQTQKVAEEMIGKIDAELSKLNKLVLGPIHRLNSKVNEAGVPAVSA